MCKIINVSTATDRSGTYYSNPVTTFIIPKPTETRYFYDLRGFDDGRSGRDCPCDCPCNRCCDCPFDCFGDEQAFSEAFRCF